MPELPEVEIVKRIIKPQIIETTIKKVIINNSKVIDYPNINEFIKFI